MIDHTVAHWGHSHHHWMSFSAELGYWIVMVVAMMLPLMLPGIRLVAFKSLRRRRHRAIAGFLVGYLVPWTVVGIAVAWLRQLPSTHTHWVTAVAFGVGAVWALAPWREFAVERCHSTTPTLGPDSDRDCVRFGLELGGWCVAVCWPFMIACGLSGHGVLAMVGALVLGVIEGRSFQSPTRVIAAGAAVLAVIYLL